MKIKTKLFLVVLMPLLLTLVVGAVIIFSYRNIERAQENGDTVRRIRSSITELNHLAMTYVSYRGERPKQQFLAENVKLTGLLADVRLRNSNQQQLLDEIRLNGLSMKDSFLRLVSNTEPPGQAGRDKLTKETEELLVGQLLVRAYSADSAASTLRNLVDEDLKNTETKTFAFIFLILAFTTIPVVIVSAQMRKRITRSLINLRRETEVVSSGILDHVISVEHNDEIGDLTQAFNRMTANLNEVTASKSDLEREMAERAKAEMELQASREALKKAYYELEVKVTERTEELTEEIDYRKRTEDALRESEEELRYLSSQILVAQEKERREIAADLHDHTLQDLNTIRLDIDRLFSQIMANDFTATLQSGKRILAHIRMAVKRIRTMQGDLWPPVLDDIGLLATINWYSREFEINHAGITIEKQIDVKEEDVPEHLKIVIYRVMQEAWKNVEQHSGADRLLLALKKDGPRVELELTDNGQGFDLEKILFRARPWAGFGLMNMKERVEHSGGTFEVSSSEGIGTTIRTAWPLNGADQKIPEARPVRPIFKKQGEPFRTVTESTSDCVYAMRLEPDGRFVRDWITPGFTLITGHDINVNLGEILHPEDKAVGKERLRFIRALQPHVCEYRIVTKNGETRWIRDSINPVADSLHPGTIRVIGAAQDITGHKQTEKLNWALGRINEWIHSSLDFDRIMDLILSEATQAIECETAAISFRREEEWVVEHVYGFSNEVIGTRMKDEEEPHALLAIRTQKPVAVNDAFNDGRVNREHMKKWGVRSVLVVPMVTEDQVIGVIFFNHQKRLYNFSDTHLDFAGKLASTVSLALKNKRHFEELQIELSEREKAEAEIRDQVKELERFNRVAVNRELRMIDLKKQINELCRRLGQPPRYPLDFEPEQESPAAATEVR
jgi:PAS domain S-box-containing protein